MDVIARALRGVTALNAGRSDSELHYLEFKDRVRALLVKACGGEAQAEHFLDNYFTAFLPTMLRAAAEQAGLADLECDNERAMIDEVMADKQGMLAHSPIIYPLNRM